MIDHIFVDFEGRIFQQIIDIPIDTTVSLSWSIFSFTPRYEAEFLQKRTKDEIITEAKVFNLIFRYFDDVLSMLLIMQTLLTRYH